MAAGEPGGLAPFIELIARCIANIFRHDKKSFDDILLRNPPPPGACPKYPTLKSCFERRKRGR